MTDRNITPLLMLVGLLSVTAQAAPAPARVLAEAQLRAINHRFVDSFVVANNDFMDALTGEDFVLTGRDGEWHDRTGFLAQVRLPGALAGASHEDVRVRLFGPVAVLQGVIEAMLHDGNAARIRYTDVYLWNDTAWQLVSAQNTQLKEMVTVQQQSGTAPSHAPWPGLDPTGDDDSVLRALNESYVQAFRDADVAWYDAHLSPDYAVVYGDGSFHDRAAALADFSQPHFATRIKSFAVDKVKIRRFGDVAVIHAENAYELKDGRKGANRYTDIWLKQYGKWQCVAAHITVHKAPT